MNNSSDLLKGLLEGDSEGIEDIYRILFPKVRKFVTNNQGTEDEAKDVFQKVLLQLITRIKVSDYKLIDAFEAYMFTACKNLWRRELNQKSRVTNHNSDEYSISNAEDDIATSILEQERWELYQRCFVLLSENCKKILGMYFNKSSYKQIKEQLAYGSESVVRQRVFKCKAKLSEFIKKDRSYKTLRDL